VRLNTRKSLKNRKIACDLDCAPSHVGRVIHAHLCREEVARRRPDFPIHRISESKWEILARAPQMHADELLDAALTESV
jgi:hypothetical protein